jgi:hypothetical protein
MWEYVAYYYLIGMPIDIEDVYIDIEAFLSG